MPDEGRPKDKKSPSLQGIQETLEEAARVSDDLIDGLEEAPVSAKADRVEDPKPKPRMDAEPRAALSDTLKQLDFLVEQAQSRLPPRAAPKRAPVATSVGGAQDIDDHLDALLGGPAGPQPKPVTVAPPPPAPPRPAAVAAPVPPPPKVTVAPLPLAPPKPVTVAAPVPPAPQPMTVAPAPPAAEIPVPVRAPSVPPVQALECEIPDPLDALERSIPELITFKAPPRQPRRGIALAIIGGLILVAAATVWVRQAPSPVPSAPADGGPPVILKTPEPSTPEPTAAPPPAVAVPKAAAPAPKPAAKPAKAPKRAAPEAPREAPAVVVVVPEAATPPPPAAEPEPVAVAAPEPVEPPASEPVEVVTAPASPPAVAAEESKVVAIPDPHQPPTLLRRVAPEIPAGTLMAGERHTVLLSALVDEQGRVVRVVVEEGLPGQRPLEAAAVNALLRWTFRPALEDGRPVRDWVTEKIVLEP